MKIEFNYLEDEIANIQEEALEKYNYEIDEQKFYKKVAKIEFYR